MVVNDDIFFATEGILIYNDRNNLDKAFLCDD